jgi:structure-specific recognition protein 1
MKGWNWGHYTLSDTALEYQVDQKPAFKIPFKDIALSTANGKNEVALEFTSSDKKGDFLCEMRFHVPNSEASSAAADEETLASKIFNQKLLAKTDTQTGSLITSVPDVPFLIPRGTYSIDFLSSKQIKLHGKTHDYKLAFADIQKVFLLHKPDRVNFLYLMQLAQPLRQGNTLHHFLLMQFPEESDCSLQVNLAEEELKEQQLDPTVSGKLHDVLCQLFNSLLKIQKIIVPGDFQSVKQHQAFSCSVKASEGFFYPLKSSIVYLHKPVLYWKHSEIKRAEFARVGQRTFDLTLVRGKSDERVTFTGINKEEH